jgi:hypothetical protein
MLHCTGLKPWTKLGPGMLISSIHIEYRNNPHLDESQQQLWAPRLGTLHFRKTEICKYSFYYRYIKTMPTKVRKCIHNIIILLTFNYIEKCNTYV